MDQTLYWCNDDGEWYKSESGIVYYRTNKTASWFICDFGPAFIEEELTHDRTCHLKTFYRCDVNGDKINGNLE